MRTTEADRRRYKRASMRHDYEEFCKYAKAPPMRRTLAATIDISLGLGFSTLLYSATQSTASFLLLILYMLVRDTGGRSLGKRIAGLVVVHPNRFSPCTLRRSLIRNSLYAAICPLFVLGSIVATTFAGMIVAAGVFVSAFALSALADVNLLFFLGYDRDNGRTIPDSWAETHVLPPGEIAAMLRMRRKIDELDASGSEVNQL